jgi:very-short-patch-repair endonuclease
MSQGVRWTPDDLRAYESRRKITRKPAVIDVSRNSPDLDPKKKLENRFLGLWTGLNGPKLEREFRFSSTRMWRADFACPQARILIEIEGGIWSNGRHNRGLGMISDAEKYFSATVEHGFIVIRLVEPMIVHSTIEKLVIFTRQLWEETQEEPTHVHD